MTICESRSEGAVGDCLGGDSGAIAGSGDIKIGDGFNVFLLLELRCSLILYVIGRVESGNGGCALRLPPLVVRSGKESPEISPHLFLWR